MENETGESLAGQVVVFTLGDEEFGLPVGRVQEIIRHQRPRSIGSSVPWVQGVISLRGRIVPVCDIGVRLGVGAEGGQGDEAKIIVVESTSGIAGIVVDGVTEVLTLTDAQIEPIPAAGTEWQRGIARLDERLIALIDPDRLLDGLSPVECAPAA